MEFSEFQKIPRLNRACVVTEKIDGTNAQVYITREDSTADREIVAFTTDGTPGILTMRVGSRNRWITPGKETDNYGFAAWCRDNATELFKLGEGQHFGEWWGRGIGRNYGKTDRTFSLFNTGRWYDEQSHLAYAPEQMPATRAPACCSVVPVLIAGPFDSQAINLTVELLKENGSIAAPGFPNPEGVIVYLAAARQLFKVTCEKDEEPKSKNTQPKESAHA